jgi:hypothetical protein
MFEQDARLLRPSQIATGKISGTASLLQRRTPTVKARWNAVRAVFNRMSDDEIGRFVQGLRSKGYMRRG